MAGPARCRSKACRHFSSPATDRSSCRYGAITFDMAYGGAFYALADCRQFGLTFGRDRVRDFVDAATALTEEAQGRIPAVASRP